MGEHGVAGNHLPFQGQDPQQAQGRLVFVGLGIHPHLAQDRRRGRHEGGEQVDARRFPVRAAPRRLAVHGHRRPALPWTAQGRLEGRDVRAAEELAERTFGGRLAAPEAQGLSQSEAVVAAELRDGLQVLHPRQHGDDRQRQHGRPRAA